MNNFGPPFKAGVRVIGLFSRWVDGWNYFLSMMVSSLCFHESIANTVIHI
jgi:hypothetical protein